MLAATKKCITKKRFANAKGKPFLYHNLILSNPMKTLFSRIAIVAAVALASCGGNDQREVVDYVNNRIGNISHLLVPTYPTSQLPGAMLRMNPDHSGVLRNSNKCC